MDRLWGGMHPVPEDRLRVLSGGETIGPWRVAYTPGHASHHVSYLHEPTGTAMVGDVAGCRIADGPILPPTPPPDVDPEAWHASLRAVAAWAPERIAITHFGTWEDVGAHLDAMHEGLDRWGERLTAPGRRRLCRRDRGGDADEDLRPGDRRGVHPRDAAEDAVGGVGAVLGRAGEGGGGRLTVRPGGSRRAGATLAPR